MRQRTTGHRFADKEYVDVDRCVYYENSVPCDVDNKVIDTQLVAIAACEAGDLLKNVNQSAVDGVVSETVLTHDVCLDTVESCDGAVSDESLKSL